MTGTQSTGASLVRIGQAITAVSAWPGRAAAWLLVPLALLVIGTVVGSLMQVGTIVRWGVDVPVLGTGLTINSLNELQWHLLAIVTMLALPYALAENRHVRVDMIYAGLCRRRRSIVDLAGDLLFLAPFCIIIGYLSIRFVTFAYTTGEQSTYGGLTDRWVVKAFLPLGLALLFLAGIGRILTHVGTLMLADTESRHG
ncbi:TRAP transporter small permease subunit [Frigidibacter mobilis]|uniref:TRAP transporter small permease protein n=1 Tax=Frigidibacter mobilis TaxID=1335048 RepID=A0A159Z2Q4_9RHOB|nr:TRAP transporter small permease subunit [Frigidibacter mobilis]AMY68384.1 hypothetical protein AKL17_1128 [Frigidibacter mobilis]